MNKLAKENVEDLERLGYFKYADPEHIDELKWELEKCISDHKQLGTVFFEELDKEDLSKDYRYVNCDLEELIEWQAEDILQVIGYSFDKFDLPYNYKRLHKGFDEDRDLAYDKIEVNGKVYVLFSTNWSQYAYDFVEIINDQLAILDSKERLYMITPGNDGDFIFLDSSLKRYFDKNVILRETFRPMDANKWIIKYAGQ